MHKSLLAAIAISTLATCAFAERVPPGTWKQTSSTMGDCPSCEISVRAVTKDIVQITGNNGWQAFASYSDKEDRYRGALQWEQASKNFYSNVLIAIDFTYEGKTITMNFKSVPLSGVGTFRLK